MSKITLTFKFNLADGEIGNVTLNNVSEDTTDAQIVALANEIIAGNTKLKGQKITGLNSCKKSILTEEEISL